MMRKMILAGYLAVAGTVAQAGGSAVVTCGNAPAGVANGQPPVLNVSYTPGADIGIPGLFWLGALAPDQKSGGVLVGGRWVGYQGGSYPFQARYDGGMPGMISFSIPLPVSNLTTGEFVGYGVYMGHGVYTGKAAARYASWRADLDSAKARLAANNRNVAAEDAGANERLIQALVQKDMTDNGKYGLALVVPYIDCTPPSN